MAQIGLFRQKQSTFYGHFEEKHKWLPVPGSEKAPKKSNRYWQKHITVLLVWPFLGKFVVANNFFKMYCSQGYVLFFEISTKLRIALLSNIHFDQKIESF